MSEARPRTRKQLQQMLQVASDRERLLKSDIEQARIQLKVARQDGEDLRTKLDEVKERLAAAETENNRMRGYLDRVMEDDHAREELIATGEPGGEQQLVPKRKHREQPYMQNTQNYADRNFYTTGEIHRCATGRLKQQPRHWVTY